MGKVEVHSGSDQSLLRSWSRVRWFGFAVAPVRDLGGDGCDEVLIGTAVLGARGVLEKTAVPPPALAGSELLRLQ